MKLLFDQNLFFRLVAFLSESYPDSAHVRDLGMASGTDLEVWEYAATHDFAIVSKDEDFHQLSFVRVRPLESSGSGSATAQPVRF